MLIARYCNIPYDLVEKRPITQYRELQERALALMTYAHTGKIELETMLDKQISAELDFQEFINNGGTLE
jgi:hypothetical protein